MKKFITPETQFIKFDISDIIETSGTCNKCYGAECAPDCIVVGCFPNN